MRTKPGSPRPPVRRPLLKPETLLGASVRYNPHLWSDTELKAIFVVRQHELEILLEALRRTPADSVPQHILITGHRGMGKSTLLRRIAVAVREEADLSRQWLALSFPEEQYTVSNLTEFWRNVLDALADAMERQGSCQEELAKLDSATADLDKISTDRREQTALALLLDTIKESGLRILLLVDGTDLLFSGISGGGDQRGGRQSSVRSDAGATPLWRLRKTLSHELGIFWLGASYQAMEAQHHYHDAFLDFFRLVELRPLTVSEMREAILALARTLGMGSGLQGESAVKEMARTLDSRPERLEALRAMTGGNPRTTVMLYDLFAAGGDGNVQNDLRGLIDLMTPLYKARMESLAEQPRKLLAHLMELWAPSLARDIAEVSGLPVTTVSGQLARLEAEGLIEKARVPGKRTGYQVSERFFNVWYLMRYSSRRLRQRLLWLVEFMRLWFSASELEDLALIRAAHHGAGDLCDEGELEYSRAVAATLPEGHEGRCRLEWSVFSAALGSSGDSRRAILEIFDFQGEDREFGTAATYRERLDRLDSVLQQCPHVAGQETSGWIAAVKGSVSLGLVEKEALAKESTTMTEERYLRLREMFRQERIELSKRFSPEATGLVCRAIKNGDFFPDCPDPKLAHTQMVAAFEGRPQAFLLALERLAARHSGEWVEKALQKAKKLGGRSSTCWNTLGNIFARVKRYSEAESAYRKAIRLGKKSVSPWNSLANLLQDVKRYQEAEAAYLKAIELDDTYAYPWNRLGNLLQDLKRYDEAEAAYRKAIKLDDAYATPWNGLGRLLRNLKHYPEAEAAYRKAIDLGDRHAYPWNGLGNLLRDLKRYDEAEAAYRKAIELDPEFVYPWNGLGYLLQHGKRYGEAEAAYRKAIELDDTFASAWYGLGYLLRGLKRYSEAEVAHLKAIERDDRSAFLWWKLGNLLRELRRYEEAEEAYRRAIELDERATLWTNLGNLLQDYLKAYEKAEAAYQRAIEMDPENPYAIANLARLEAVTGRRDQATLDYRRVATLSAKGQSTGTAGVDIALQSNIWLGNQDAARTALERLAVPASEGDRRPFRQIQEQTWECHEIGIGEALAELMEGSPYADFLRPFSLALRSVAAGGEDALAGFPPEVTVMAEEVRAELQKRASHLAV